MFSNLPLFPEQASTMAKDVDLLFAYILGVALFFSLLIASLIITFAIRYRRRSDDDRPEDIHGMLALELVWSLIPFGLAMVMFVWGASIYMSLSRPPDNALDVYAVGKQWMWKLQHMEGRQEINELHVPVGQPVKLTLTSEDVIHSFYIPAFRIKMDAVPGRYTHTWFEATKPGKYHLFCAEYCGTQHSGMIGSVYVMERAEYQAWLAGGGMETTALAPAAAGQKLFEGMGCATCHRQVGGALGPALAGLFGKTVEIEGGQSVVADEDYLRESILNPRAKIVAGYRPVMPTFQGLIAEQQLIQLIQYIKGLGSEDQAPGSGDPTKAEAVQ
jgi:cytochrome c oxidase subunit 2